MKPCPKFQVNSAEKVDSMEAARGMGWYGHWRIRRRQGLSPGEPIQTANKKQATLEELPEPKRVPTNLRIKA